MQLPCLLWAGLQETPAALAHLMRGTGAVLLQREVPEHVNEAVAAAAVAAKVPVLLVRRLRGAVGLWLMQAIIQPLPACENSTQ
jgi:hypothetical protein